VSAVNVFVYSVLGAAVYVTLGLGVCHVAQARYGSIEYILVYAGCAGAIVGAVAGGTQLITAAVRGKPNRPADGA
jgi:hypothetical protein